MIEQSYHDGPFEVACDSCSEDTEIDTDGDWHGMIQELKNNGWAIRNENGEWRHYCPDCAKAKGLTQTYRESFHGRRS